jgi:hypothetical protein
VARLRRAGRLLLTPAETEGAKRPSFPPVTPGRATPLTPAENGGREAPEFSAGVRDNRGVPQLATTLDSALRERLHAVLARQPVTEAELRKLAEEGRACRLIIGAELERAEHRVGELSADPASSLAELADRLRVVNELRPHLAELDALLDALERRARESRASWLTAR